MRDLTRCRSPSRWAPGSSWRRSSCVPGRARSLAARRGSGEGDGRPRNGRRCRRWFRAPGRGARRGAPRSLGGRGRAVGLRGRGVPREHGGGLEAGSVLGERDPASGARRRRAPGAGRRAAGTSQARRVRSRRPDRPRRMGPLPPSRTPARPARSSPRKSRLGILPGEDLAVLVNPWRRWREPRFGRADERREYVRSALLLTVAMQQQRRRSGEANRLRQLEVLAFRTRVRRVVRGRVARTAFASARVVRLSGRFAVRNPLRPRAVSSRGLKVTRSLWALAFRASSSLSGSLAAEPPADEPPALRPRRLAVGARTDAGPRPAGGGAPLRLPDGHLSTEELGRPCGAAREGFALSRLFPGSVWLEEGFAFGETPAGEVRVGKVPQRRRSRRPDVRRRPLFPQWRQPEPRLGRPTRRKPAVRLELARLGGALGRAERPCRLGGGRGRASIGSVRVASQQPIGPGFLPLQQGALDRSARTVGRDGADRPDRRTERVPSKRHERRPYGHLRTALVGVPGALAVCGRAGCRRSPASRGAGRAGLARRLSGSSCRPSSSATPTPNGAMSAPTRPRRIHQPAAVMDRLEGNRSHAGIRRARIRTGESVRTFNAFWSRAGRPVPVRGVPRSGPGRERLKR